MDKRTLGTNGLEVSAIGLGCMSMTGGYSDKPDRQEMISLIRTPPWTGASPSSTPPRSTARYVNEELVGEALAPFRGQVVIATKFGWDIDPSTRKPSGRVTSRPEVHQAGRRRLAAAARRRHHRSLLPAPRRPGRADRGRRGRGQGAHRGRQGEAFRHVRGGRRDDPPGARGPAGDGRAERVLAVVAASRGRGAGRVRGAGHRVRAVQPARQGLPHRHHHRVDQLRRRQRHPQHHPAVRAGRAPAQPGRRRSARQHRRNARAPRPARSPWPGCWPRSPGSCRSPAPASCTDSRRTSAPPTSSCRPTNSPRSRTPRPRSRCEGGRYSEAAERMTNL